MIFYELSSSTIKIPIFEDVNLLNNLIGNHLNKNMSLDKMGSFNHDYTSNKSENHIKRIRLNPDSNDLKVSLKYMVKYLKLNSSSEF